jgi:hypothetical protein
MFEDDDAGLHSETRPLQLTMLGCLHILTSVGRYQDQIYSCSDSNPRVCSTLVYFHCHIIQPLVISNSAQDLWQFLPLLLYIEAQRSGFVLTTLSTKSTSSRSAHESSHPNIFDSGFALSHFLLRLHWMLFLPTFIILVFFDSCLKIPICLF